MSNINDDIKKAYDSFAAAETAGEKDPYIRTRVIPKGGSTAFGPVQITYTLAKDKVGKLSPTSQEFFKTVLEPMYIKFQKLGDTPAGKKNPAYDYGGTGNFPVEKAPEYELFAGELLGLLGKETGGDINKLIKRWRGKTEQEDPAYYKRFRDKYTDINKAIMGK